MHAVVCPASSRSVSTDTHMLSCFLVKHKQDHLISTGNSCVCDRYDTCPSRWVQLYRLNWDITDKDFIDIFDLGLLSGVSWERRCWTSRISTWRGLAAAGQGRGLVSTGIEFSSPEVSKWVRGLQKCGSFLIFKWWFGYSSLLVGIVARCLLGLVQFRVSPCCKMVSSTKPFYRELLCQLCTCEIGTIGWMFSWAWSSWVWMWVS